MKTIESVRSELLNNYKETSKSKMLSDFMSENTELKISEVENYEDIRTDVPVLHFAKGHLKEDARPNVAVKLEGEIVAYCIVGSITTAIAAVVKNSKRRPISPSKLGAIMDSSEFKDQFIEELDVIASLYESDRVSDILEVYIEEGPVEAQQDYLTIIFAPNVKEVTAINGKLLSDVLETIDLRL